MADQDIRATGIALNLERAYEPPPIPSPAPKVEATPTAPSTVKLPLGFYNASNSVEVAIRNLESAGKVLSARRPPAPISSTITELDSGGGGPVPTMAMAKSSANVPVESGELTIGTSVQIVYALSE